MIPAGNAHRGFTLIELLLVASIMVILAGIAVPRFSGMNARYGLQAGAARFEADLARAIGHAKQTSASQIFEIDPDAGTLSVLPAGVDTPPPVFVTDLTASPYEVSIDQLTIGGVKKNDLAINGFGDVLEPVFLVISRGNESITIYVNAPTGGMTASNVRGQP